MRVRLLSKYRLYWDYAVHELREGAEYVGDFARHLASTGAPVEVIEHDPEPDPVPDQPPAPAAGPGPDGAGQPPAPDGLDIAGTIDTVLTWVDGDPGRAQLALDAERAKGDSARATLTTRLDAILSTP
ncbi:hypothetical protein [Kitasatospora sp. NPDC018619]|uniref:hypothetical protein n=1 Tax=unclassified Kitasatospora TaxID=2633591 RepID=UPI0037B64214